jgi:REP element-mobilizing transposase RayT
MLRIQRPGQRALRRGRVSEHGRVYCLTTVVACRHPLFLDFRAARVVIHAMRDLQLEGQVVSLAFVVMPDHLHWLIELGSGSLERVMRLLKTRSARRIHRAGLFRGPVWQAGFHDRAARRDDNIVAMARYIAANPIRAGLARHLGDYPHWDCAWLS